MLFLGIMVSHGEYIDGEDVFVDICVNEKSMIDDLFEVITIFGHSNNSIGFIDRRSDTLFSNDAVQQYGISMCRMYVFDGVDAANHIQIKPKGVAGGGKTQNG